jgi:hypothetical protein
MSEISSYWYPSPASLQNQPTSTFIFIFFGDMRTGVEFVPSMFDSAAYCLNPLFAPLQDSRWGIRAFTCLLLINNVLDPYLTNLGRLAYNVWGWLGEPLWAPDQGPCHCVSSILKCGLQSVWYYNLKPRD